MATWLFVSVFTMIARNIKHGGTTTTTSSSNHHHHLQQQQQQQHHHQPPVPTSPPNTNQKVEPQAATTTPRFPTILVARPNHARPSDLELLLRPHCQRMRVLERLSGGAHFVVPVPNANSALAVRGYQLDDFGPERTRYIDTNSNKKNNNSNLMVPDPSNSQDDWDGVRAFVRQYQWSVIFFVLPGDGAVYQQQMRQRNSFLNWVQNQTYHDLRSGTRDHSSNMSHMNNKNNSTSPAVTKETTTSSSSAPPRILVLPHATQAVSALMTLVDAVGPHKRELRHEYMTRQQEQFYCERSAPPQQQQQQQPTPNREPGHNHNPFMAQAVASALRDWCARSELPTGEADVLMMHFRRDNIRTLQDLVLALAAPPPPPASSSDRCPNHHVSYRCWLDRVPVEQQTKTLLYQLFYHPIGIAEALEQRGEYLAQEYESFDTSPPYLKPRAGDNTQQLLEASCDDNAATIHHQYGFDNQPPHEYIEDLGHVDSSYDPDSDRYARENPDHDYGKEPNALAPSSWYGTDENRAAVHNYDSHDINQFKPPLPPGISRQSPFKSATPPAVPVAGPWVHATNAAPFASPATADRGTSLGGATMRSSFHPFNMSMQSIGNKNSSMRRYHVPATAAVSCGSTTDDDRWIAARRCRYAPPQSLLRPLSLPSNAHISATHHPHHDVVATPSLLSPPSLPFSHTTIHRGPIGPFQSMSVQQPLACVGRTITSPWGATSMSMSTAQGGAAAATGPGWSAILPDRLRSLDNPPTW